MENNEQKDLNNLLGQMSTRPTNKPIKSKDDIDLLSDLKTLNVSLNAVKYAYKLMVTIPPARKLLNGKEVVSRKVSNALNRVEARTLIKATNTFGLTKFRNHEEGKHLSDQDIKDAMSIVNIFDQQLQTQMKGDIATTASVVLKGVGDTVGKTAHGVHKASEVFHPAKLAFNSIAGKLGFDPDKICNIIGITNSAIDLNQARILKKSEMSELVEYANVLKEEAYAKLNGSVPMGLRSDQQKENQTKALFSKIVLTLKLLKVKEKQDQNKSTSLEKKPNAKKSKRDAFKTRRNSM